MTLNGGPLGLSMIGTGETWWGDFQRITTNVFACMTHYGMSFDLFPMENRTIQMRVSCEEREGKFDRIGIVL